MSNKKVVVKVNDLTKMFRIPIESSSGIKQKLINLLKGRKGYRVFTPLKNISFEVNEGDFFGIVGRNGSGKSTLLKTIAGIYYPNGGTVQVNGKLVPFIELGVGFNPELTGRENIFLNGALLGFSHQEMETMYDEIVDFAELGAFMEERLKNYSSGMQVRLAFSIAIKAKGDILILDEVLAVGDTAFQKKCFDYFVKLKKDKKTVILVTHDMANVERFCNRVLVLNQGGIVGIFEAQKGKRIYDQLNRSNDNSVDSPNIVRRRWGSEKARVSHITINNSRKTRPVVKQGESLNVTIKFEKKTTVPIVVGLGFYDEAGTYVSGPNSFGEKKLISSKEVTFSTPKTVFNPGIYRLEISVFDDMQIEEYDHIIDAIYFEVVDHRNNNKYGKIELFGEWR